MTTQRLRDLMEERVADVETDDLATRAWARADGVRRRRRIAVTGTAVAAVLVVAGGVAVLDDRPPPRTRPRAGRPDHDAVAARRRPTTAAAPRAVARRRVPRRAVLVGAARRARLRAPGARRCRGSPTGCRWPTRTRSRRHRTTWTRCSARASSSTACSATTGSVGRPVGPARSRWPTRAATCSTRSDPGAVSPDGTQVFFRQPGRVEVWDLPTNTLADGRDVRTPSRRRGPGTGRPRRPAARRATGPVGPRRPPVVSPDRGGPGGTAPSWTGWPRARRRPSRASPATSPTPSSWPPAPRRARACWRSAMGRNKMCCVADGAGSATTSCCSRPRRPTAPTGCWPGGSARRTCTASATYVDIVAPERSSASWAEDAFR